MIDFARQFSKFDQFFFGFVHITLNYSKCKTISFISKILLLKEEYFLFVKYIY